MGCSHSQQRSQQSLEIPRNPMEFHSMIRTRIEERRVKMEVKRQGIVEWLKKKVTRFQNESKVKLFGLPDEVWELILSQVKNPMDLWSMWQVHPKFRHLSGELQAQECLFSQLLRIKNLPHLWKDEKQRMSTLKIFRKLSKGMKTSVDHLIKENLIKALQVPGSQASCYFVLNLNSMESFDGIYGNFCEGSNESRAKLVFHRSLQLILFSWHEVDYEQYVRFRNNVTSLLELVGEQIWNFKYVLDDNFRHLQKIGVSVNEVYSLLVDWISLMQNLKWLELDFRNGNSEDIITQETFDHHSFPHLLHLERLRFGAFSNDQLRLSFVSSVILSNLHVKSLHFTGLASAEAEHSFFTEMKPILCMLNLNAFEGYSRGFALDILQPLFSITWKLNSLSLRYILESLDLNVLFTHLNSIPTLEYLSLSLGKTTIGKKIPHLTLPHLTQIELNFDLRSVSYFIVKNVIFFTSLQFLILSKKLRSLKWSFIADWNFFTGSLKGFQDFLKKQEKNEMIKFKCGFAELAESNIWDVFPELEYVETKVPRDDGFEEKPHVICRPKLLMIK